MEEYYRRMKKLSLWDFKQVCKDLSTDKYVIKQDNPVGEFSIKNAIQLSFNANKIAILFKPNTIILHNNENSYIKLNRVKYVKQRDDKPLNTSLFDVVCSDFDNPENELVYTISTK